MLGPASDQPAAVLKSYEPITGWNHSMAVATS